MTDQADILEANERLTAEVATLTASRDQAAAEVASLSAEVETLRANLAAVTAERDARPTEHDFNARLAAELLRHGIRDTGVATTAAETTGAPRAMTLTEQCLAARGR